MKHLHSKKDFEVNKPNLSEFAPVGTKDCEGKCERSVVMTKNGPVITCSSCKRIVMDNRDK
jgi:hypothetical protein